MGVFLNWKNTKTQLICIVGAPWPSDKAYLTTWSQDQHSTQESGNKRRTVQTA